MSSVRGNVVTTKTWTPAVPVKRPDNIISSDYARTSRVFTPSYERECRPCMEQLIANEYQRIWWQEREAWNARQALARGKAKKFQWKSEGSSHNVTPAKSTSRNLQTKATKADVTAETREKNVESTGKKKNKP